MSAAVGLATAAAIALTEAPAVASTTYESAYGFERTWNAALRLVRVDMGLKVVEKDDATGYLMFEYRAPDSGKKASSGSMEFVRRKEADAPVQVVVQLPAMPRYHEQVLLDSLVRKMKAEYGEAPSRPHSTPPAVPEDAGTD